MLWTVEYLPEVHDDLASLDGASVRKVEKVIIKNIVNGSPDKLGKPLRKELANCRRLRVGDIRIVYKIFEQEIKVLVIAVGMRRDNEIHLTAKTRAAKELVSLKPTAKKKAKKRSSVKVIK